MRIAVQDANVLIDLELAGLFDLWFQLGVETHTTDLIKGELEDGGHVQALAYFKSGQVREHGLSFEELDQVSELEREVGSKAKFNDCSVLFLAMKLDAMLISGDKAPAKGRQGTSGGGAWHAVDHGPTGGWQGDDRGDCRGQAGAPSFAGAVSARRGMPDSPEEMETILNQG
jgi:hypothetical protein